MCLHIQGDRKYLQRWAMLLLFCWMQIQNTPKLPNGWSSAASISNFRTSPTFFLTPSTRKAKLVGSELQLKHLLAL